MYQKNIFPEMDWALTTIGNFNIDAVCFEATAWDFKMARHYVE